MPAESDCRHTDLNPQQEELAAVNSPWLVFGAFVLVVQSFRNLNKQVNRLVTVFGDEEELLKTSAGSLHMLLWVFGTACVLGATDFRAGACRLGRFYQQPAIGLFM